MSRSILLFCVGLLPLFAAVSGHAADPTDVLYTSNAIVTGKGEKNRRLGFRDCLDRVLVRVSGDQRLPARPEVAAMRDNAGDLVASFDYRDLLEGIPIHDEQGSYDRPHALTCHFGRDRLDAALAALGSRPWLGRRPTVVPLLAVERGDKRFILTADGDDGPFMDASFAAAAETLAMRIALPPRGEIAAMELDGQTLWRAKGETLASLARAAGGDVPLLGRLGWSDADLGWVADWRIAFEGETYDWQVRGVNFDEAFRVAMRGAAQVLSGNGQP
jgi:hypothetical protein